MSDARSSADQDRAFGEWRDAVSIDIEGERDIAETIPAQWVRRIVLDHAEGRHRIFSGLRICRATLTGDLRLENLDVAFPVFFERCTFQGVAQMWGIRGRTFGFEHCELQQGANMRNTQIDGHLLMRGDFIAKGPLVLRDMTVRGTIDLRGARLLYNGETDNPLKDIAEGECIGLSRTSATSLFWGTTATPTKERPCDAEKGHRPAARVTLRDVSVKSFRHDLATCELAAWPAAGALILEGFSYERMDECPEKIAAKWLALQPRPTPSALFALAGSLEREGQRDRAERVRAQIKRIEIDNYPPVRRLLARVAFAAINYGASPLRALALALGVIFLLFCAVSWLDRSGRMAPAVDAGLLETCRYGLDRGCVQVVARWPRAGSGTVVSRYVPPDYPTLSPLLYALESVVPPFDFGQRRYWQPRSDSVGLLLSFVALIGLFLGGLSLAALTGLFTPKER